MSTGAARWCSGLYRNRWWNPIVLISFIVHLRFSPHKFYIFSRGKGKTIKFVRNRLDHEKNSIGNRIGPGGQQRRSADKTDQDSLMVKAEKYVKAVGLTDADIEAIRNIMWEK